MAVIDAKDLILGRICTAAAKRALLGEKIDIINCEKSMVSGKKKYIIANYLRKLKLGIPLQGPYFPRQPDRVVRRTVRGMLPWKRNRGREAFKNVMCYIGVPEQFAGKTAETVKGAHYSKLPNLNFMMLGDICKHIGGK